MNTRKQLDILKSLTIEKFTDNDVRADLQKFIASWEQIWDAAFNHHDEHYEEAGIDVSLITELGNAWESMDSQVNELKEIL